MTSRGPVFWTLVCLVVFVGYCEAVTRLFMDQVLRPSRLRLALERKLERFA
jgi:hypothetical protein